MDLDLSKNSKKNSFLKNQCSKINLPEILGLVLAIGWIAFSIYLFSARRLETYDNFLIQLLIIFVPFAMICLCLIIIRTTRIVQEETRLIHTAVETLRKTYIDQQKLHSQTKPEAFILRRLDELTATQRKIQNGLTMMNTERLTERQSPNCNRQKSNHLEVKTDQPSLELGTHLEDLDEPPSIDDFVAALNFPETAEDEEGFAALKRALTHRETAILIQAAQDVLTLLSQDGIYMDDLRPDIVHPDAWRQFAKGERGRKITLLGGVRDRSSLALTNGRMKQDPVFRDTAHHFLKTFDEVFANFEKIAKDAEISAFSQTRTALAFMLVGRVAGTFD
ncbi:MAG: hypothetical protein CML56_07805 [Rhodobacteraceae bacterium]|nr:hypothetical protein [Paracoccaceae bacterium]